jgi:hypothetical protein
VIRWKQDLRRITAEYLKDKEKKEAGKKQKLEDVKRRIAEREHELRVNPTAADIQNGLALNALLYDLMDPDIRSGDWHTKVVQLPTGMSVKDLIFRFTPASGSANASKVLSRGVIALSRLDVSGDSWPTVMKNAGLDKARASYETAYAKLRKELLQNNFDVKTLLALDRSLDVLKDKVQIAVPIERGYRDEALKFVDELRDSTHMFDAVTVEYAREMLVDTNGQDATTVAELVSFMLKYRLQFASAERSPTGRVLYAQIYESMRQQMELFGIKPTPPPGAPVVAAAEDRGKTPFQPQSVWVGDNGGWILTVIEVKGETFRATFKTPDGSREGVLSGTVKGNQVSWLGKNAVITKGGLVGRDSTGTITTGKEGDKIEVAYRNPQNNRDFGTFVYRKKGK